MSKEELLKIQTCILKVDIHCDGCKRKVRKILQKIEGVYKVSVDSEQGKVTVSGNVDPHSLIKKLEKCGKPAQVWGFQKERGENKNEQQKGGPTPQQLQQLHQLKAFQDLKLPPQLKDMKLPSVGGGDCEKGGQKSVKFKVPEIDESDEEYDDDEFDDDDDDDDDDDEDEEEDDESDDDTPMRKHGEGSEKGNMTMIGGGKSQNISGNINVNMSGVTGPMKNQQQQLMNQQRRPNNNERFQPMMYPRQLPDANHMQPSYPYPKADPLTHLFSDDNTSSCNLM